jgi:hypothetical protein
MSELRLLVARMVAAMRLLELLHLKRLENQDG